MLLLLDVAEGWVAEDAGCTAGVAELAQGCVEAAGHGFHEKCKLVLGICSDAAAEDEEVGDEDAAEEKARREAWEERNQDRPELTACKPDDDEDLYEVLGLGHLGFTASQSQIKKGYQKALLIHHPDKLSPEERKKAEQQQIDNKVEPLFLKVQRAFDTLSNPIRRRGYDSQFAFDDEIPDGDEDPSEFYEVYGPVFEANARFSEKKPVPLLGDENTPIDQVKMFYKFWNTFDSWRDFSKFDEFKNGDIESAESRGEKRWMQHQNETQQAKRKKKEYERLRLLVSRAMECDPRIARAREEEKQEKQRLYLERKMAKEAEQRAKYEAANAEKIEKERLKREKEEKEAAIRADTKATKKAFKRQLRFLRKACDAAVTLLGEEDEDLEDSLFFISEWYSNAADIIPLLSVFVNGEETTDYEPKTPELARAGLDAVLVAALNGKAERDDAKKTADERREEALAEEERQRQQAKAEINKNWTPDELSMLAKGIRKFPPGARNRWLMVANYINTMPAIEVARTPEDCIHQSKIMISDTEQRRQLGTSSAAFEQHQKKLHKDSITAEDEQNPNPVDPADEEADEADATDDVWTPEQQAALEQALKEFPASMEKNERWKSIAKAVPGKKKKDCVERFKQLRQLLMEKQQQR
mmetsp:Transcript_2710/g.4527  ORF Transcript_2710/g.4527 Transcript_2710/m.4527 type:complete len:643 (+) Transcript_2710:121-2049(+)|eukprot:CAMPEP_0184522264 /NCGR_PEP_ID=MMETSP0198_2-20121128/8189_1 /TAXON_ID=1112570 /ORGANISM="Thraustochytrium sp., Strain LLF1b" /LENGTH=642 /DNA_ID=CAMNT_0026913079 /DNA_START=118 /DNA_END=2046 /DNA_ORIENTATION=-